MNWVTFAIATYAAAVLDVGLANLWGLPDGAGATPSMLLILGVFIAMAAPPMTVAWTTLILGLTMDLIALRAEAQPILGPSALGMLTAGWGVLQLRGLLFRQSPLALAALTLIAAGLMHAVIILMLNLRGIPWLTGQPLENWSLADQLYHRFLDGLYSAIVAWPMGLVLFRLEPLFGLATPKHRAY